MTTAGRSCPFCGLRYHGAPTECPGCGTLLATPSEELRRLGEAERRLLRSRKALSDTLFLIGLLLGGPLSTTEAHFLPGSLVILAGGAASALRRYTSWSLSGVVAIGSLLALVVAAMVVEPAYHAVEETRAGEEARLAFAQALNRRNDDVAVEARVAGALAIWFTLPQSEAGECGSYPPADVRAHLADLGFLRIVVAAPNQAGGLCSFVP